MTTKSLINVENKVISSNGWCSTICWERTKVLLDRDVLRFNIGCAKLTTVYIDDPWLETWRHKFYVQYRSTAAGVFLDHSTSKHRANTKLAPRWPECLRVKLPSTLLKTRLVGKGSGVIKVFLKNLIGNQTSSKMLYIKIVPIDNSTSLNCQYQG